ncbi:MAG TPA: VWA domain-containing protein [Flavilitoribacter sp.]|nr:VWA domain-containing protein [Flavilitoribacter sp.]
MKNFILFILACCSLNFLTAREPSTPSPIVFIYDASGSMWGKMGDRTKMEIASTVLAGSLEKLGQEQQVGLVAYGHRQKSDCKDVEFLVGIENTSKKTVADAVKGIKPLGKTPLAYSATQVFDRLRATKTSATVILVTDGIESCDGNICEVVKAAKAEGIDFRLHIVGFGLQPGESAQLECAAKAGDGRYFDAADADGLADVLNVATETTVDDPPATFSVFAIKNGKPVDAIVTAFKAGSKDEADRVRTYRDTGFLSLTPGKYDLAVAPLENTDLSALSLTVEVLPDAITHRTVSFDGAKVQVTTLNNGEGWDASVQILERRTNKPVASGRTYGRPLDMEVDPGTYDLLIKALALEGADIEYKMENVEIKAGEVKTLSHAFASGVALIGVKSGGELADATVFFTDVKTGKNVAGGRTDTADTSNPKKFLLTPGTYSVAVTTLGKHKGHKDTFQIEVKAGQTVEKNLSF